MIKTIHIIGEPKLSKTSHKVRFYILKKQKITERNSETGIPPLGIQKPSSKFHR